RDHRTADGVPLETAELEHLPGADLAFRVLEDRPERPLVGRLGRLALLGELADAPANVVRAALAQPVLDPRDDLAAPEVRVTIREAELGRRQPARAVGARHERADEDRAPVAAVGAGVHPDAAARGAWD